MTPRTRDHYCPLCGSLDTDLEGSSDTQDLDDRTVLDELHGCRTCGMWWWSRWELRPGQWRPAGRTDYAGAALTAADQEREVSCPRS